MATAPVLQYLQLDSSYDPIFDPSVALTNVDAVAQAIQTRLKLFLGEWWENIRLGLPAFQAILGQLGSQQGLSAMTLAVQQNIAGTPFVTNVGGVTVLFQDGVLSITATVQTVFGTTTISTAPALTEAGLGQ